MAGNCIQLYIHCGDLNSGPDSCGATSLPTEPPPQLTAGLLLSIYQPLLLFSPVCGKEEHSCCFCVYLTVDEPQSSMFLMCVKSN